MEASSVPASSPRVYMPISHPDSPAPTYAVLQLVGYSDPSPQSPNFVYTSARSSPSSNWAADSRDGIPLPAGLVDPSKANASGNSGLHIGLPEAEGLCTQENHSPENSSAGNPSPQSSSTGNFFCADNPSPRGSCLDSPSCSSLSKGFDKKSVSIKPSPMKKTGVSGPTAASVGAKKCSKVGPTGGTISVSHTEKETIVHTHSSNFREVVHQLTGASGDDSDLLPVTVPSRAPASRGNGDDANRCLTKQDPFATCDYTGRSSEFGLRKSMPMKLFERRRSSKTLERISTSCRDLPPLVPSPVTPLASDFERICLPVTPVASPTVVPTQERSIVQMQSPSALRQNGNVQLYPSYNQPAMYMFPNSIQSQPSAENLYAAASEPHNVAHIVQTQREASIEDFAIAEKGFFLHPQRPKNSEPALLPLFPESPRDQ